MKQALRRTHQGVTEKNTQSQTQKHTIRKKKEANKHRDTCKNTVRYNHGERETKKNKNTELET